MLVEERRWLTVEEFTDVFGLCNLLPGPNTLNITIVVGARFHGWRGALVGVAGLLSLPLTVALLLGGLFAHIGTMPGIEAVLRGVGAAVAGLVLATGIKMAASLGRTPRALGFLIVTVVAIALLRWPLVPVLLALIPLSVLVAWIRHA
jgi:chromate transporter